MKIMNRVVLAVILNKDKVLVAKVHKDHIEKFKGLKYVLPGGMVEDGETHEEALKREIKEETGYDISVKAQISFWISPTTGEEVYSYLCRTKDVNKPTRISNDNTESLHWFTIEDLVKNYPEMNPDVMKYLRYTIREV
jgi:8-oxo-dGTP pyrophosphatase MutT (NUDIX family)